MSLSPKEQLTKAVKEWQSDDIDQADVSSLVAVKASNDQDGTPQSTPGVGLSSGTGASTP